MTIPELAAWHDIECGRYEADLPLWKELAKASEHGVLDIGAGTGRVALRLAHAGFDVTALDLEPELLAGADAARPEAGFTIPTVAADACDFTLERQFDLIIVPMQTIQLLPARAGLLRLGPSRAAPRRPPRDRHRDRSWRPTTAARRCPRPTSATSATTRTSPSPSRSRSATTARRSSACASASDPTRSASRPTTGSSSSIVSPGTLAEEAAAHGLEADELLHIEETPDHVASEVVVFRG